MSQLLQWGAPLDRARTAVILVHGRGASGHDMAGLAKSFPAEGVGFMAPSAPTRQWYPSRFFVPLEENEPDLTQALVTLAACVERAREAGLGTDRVAFIGFSQGACLSLEFVARHPARYAFVGAISGGVIGPLDTPREPFDLRGTPVLIGCAEADPHIPLPYVQHSIELFRRSGAELTPMIYRGSAHMAFPEEIRWIAERLDGRVER